MNFIEIHPVLLWVAVFWTLAWKGWALWIAARAEKKWWFVALLLINTLGILEMVYIFFIERHHKKEGVVKNIEDTNQL